MTMTPALSCSPYLGLPRRSLPQVLLARDRGCLRCFKRQREGVSNECQDHRETIVDDPKERVA